ncbi:MAG TPA: response regulator [Xanthobacteraceae bacterium]|nr:response regulator [Xanthobacteraceae bacterium]
MIKLFTLTVDDEPDIREIIDLSLALDPLFAVRECPSGRDAVRTAIEWRPDLILLDVMMPIMDGPTTLAELRADRRTATIPVVFMTARVQTREQARFRSLGAAGVIAKPFDPMRLPALVRDCVAAAPAEDFMRRLAEASVTLTAWRSDLAGERSHGTLMEIKRLARTLADASRRSGFAGMALELASLQDAAASRLAGQGAPLHLENALDRVVGRIAVA